MASTALDDTAGVRVLVADDEDDLLRICSEVLQSKLVTEAGQPVIRTAANGREARELLLREAYELIILDVQMPGVSGLELMHFALEHGNGAQVVLITAYPNYGDAVEAIKEGAFDYIVKPFTATQLGDVALRALTEGRQPARAQAAAEQAGAASPLERLLGESSKMRETRELLERVAPLRENVVLLGETGTGKGLTADILHDLGPNRARPHVTLDCGAIPRELIESELFGHEKGAFTGASGARKGLLELAGAGTLFLDEVSEIPLELQSRLLRALQERDFRRVGGSETRRFEARVIAASNQDLQAAARDGRFRTDLFYRLHVIPISLPALREHPEDIELLANAFLSQFGSQNPERGVVGIHPEALETMRRYDWLGNVRELENVIRRAAALAQHAEIRLPDLPEEVRSQPSGDGSEGDFSRTRERWLSRFEERYFRGLLRQTAGNVVEAARCSGVPRATLYRYLRKHGLDPAHFRVSEPGQALTSETDS
ncbi:MAG: sigma-54-dependent transcriptional regulator [Thermoanaerobaculia bacterium]